MNILAECDRCGIRLEADGDALKVDAPKDALLPDLLALLKAYKPDLLAALTQPANLDTLLAEACQGVPGIDATTFRALLSAEDAQDIEGGHIPVVTLNAYARSFAEGIRTGRITVLAAAIPKSTLPSRVRCNDCHHFEPDTIGDGSGIGACTIHEEGARQPNPCLWPRVERVCNDFERRREAP